MSKKTELRAATARLLYNSNRSTSDYDMLIDFIDSHFDHVEAVVRELEKEYEWAKLSYNETADTYYLGVMTAYDNTIQILERGGRNEK